MTNKFFTVPTVKTDEDTVQLIDQLQKLINDFQKIVKKSGRSKNTCCRLPCYYLFCCNFSCFTCSRFKKKDRAQSKDLLFGDLYQSKLILEKNFEGK